MTVKRSAVIGFRPLFDCDDCDGKGRELITNHDEHGYHAVVAPCEGCAACGQLSECKTCQEVIPASDERCDACRDHYDREEQQDLLDMVRRGDL